MRRARQPRRLETEKSGPDPPKERRSLGKSASSSRSSSKDKVLGTSQESAGEKAGPGVRGVRESVRATVRQTSNALIYDVTSAVLLYVVSEPGVPSEDKRKSKKYQKISLFQANFAHQMFLHVI